MSSAAPCLSDCAYLRETMSESRVRESRTRFDRGPLTEPETRTTSRLRRRVPLSGRLVKRRLNARLVIIEGNRREAETRR